jgi:hypothetical protein
LSKSALQTLLALDRHWEFAPTQDGRFRALIYGPTGETVSYASEPHPEMQDACIDVVQRWEWQQALEREV